MTNLLPGPKAPGDRYESAGAFVADLKAYLVGAEVSAHRYGPWERVRGAVRRHPTLLVGLVAGTLALAGLGLAYAARQGESAARERAGRAEQEAQARKAKADEAERSGDVFVLKELRERADKLWPAVSTNVGAMEKWLEDARALVDRLGERRRVLTELRARATSRGADDAPELGWKFPTAAEAFEHGWLTGLVNDVKGLEAPDPNPGKATLAGVAARRELAQRVERTSKEEARAWDEAKALVAGSPRYGGHDLEPVEGLVPIGQDPNSGLLEAWHVASGERPRRGPDGRLVLTDTTGLVLVLIPGGRFRMGSDSGQAQERPVHEVWVKAFFLSKYEMTQAQWTWATGESPSMYKAGENPGGKEITPRNPVEQVSWDDCRETLRRLGLVLPSEAQWEYAARAGTETRWWTGDAARSLVGAANLADQSYRRGGGTTQAEAWDDGHAVHAPVGSFRANAFGLHDVVGNVWEWTADAYHDNYTGAPDDGSVWHPAAGEPVGASYRVNRGGSWNDVASNGRSANRSGNSPAFRNSILGVRPAR